MPTQQTQPEPSSPKSVAGLFGNAQTHTRVRANKPSAVKVEPTMRALRRILGDDVLDIFPEGLAENVDALYEAHTKESDQWAEIPLDTVQERDDLLALMRAYAECANHDGYTIRQDRTAEPTVLRVRVTTRKGSGKPDESDDAG